MKKHLLLAALWCAGVSMAHATVYPVSVSNFQFNPATVNAAVGDTITWTWVAGSFPHTTTCEPASQGAFNSLPDGAATWNVPMNSTSITFSYVLKVSGTYHYSCIPHASFGMVGVINASSVLPVTLLNFGASLTPDGKALLKWSVANEQNVSYYSVQKSMDGSAFTDIGKVTATGTASQKEYTYTDGTAASSHYVYYTIKTVDKDGKTQLSPIVLFTNNKVKSGIIISMSPNPINSPGHLMLQFNAEKDGSLQVQLFDAGGKLVKQTTMTATAGVNNGHFHLGELPPGAYTVVFLLDGKKETRRLIFE